MDTGDTAWMLTSTALVLFMTPGLAFFYGGMVRSKNVLTFAVITPALIIGATADRMKFSAYVLFIGLWLLLVYAPVAHWVFGGGWLADLGALDFAGGAVVHINAGGASGAVAGLVAMTPCAGFVGGLTPIAIGAIAGAVCFLAISLKTRFGYDDSLDVVGVHLVGGLVGSLLLGLFADTSATGLGTDGLFFGGGAGLLGDQLVASVATLAFSFAVSFAIAKVLDLAIGIRVGDEDEETGLDLSQHAETAYSLL